MIKIQNSKFKIVGKKNDKNSKFKIQNSKLLEKRIIKIQNYWKKEL